MKHPATRTSIIRLGSGFARHASTSSQWITRVPRDPVRTRFAPSPTGNLHLGSLRTALFNYLLAKRTGGQFLLRIEDTDRKRTIPGAEEGITRDLRWAGIHWDEGPVTGGPNAPYRQSERTHIYRNHTAVLLNSKNAYRCFCSAERLDTLSRCRHEKGLPVGYDRNCAHLSRDESDLRAEQGEDYVVRLRAPDKYSPWHDFVYGNTGKAEKKSQQYLTDGTVYKDPILVKSNGHPTYHLANVIDDHLMEITHVIRGSEWMSSTPMHLALYNAFGWEPPLFGHVPLLVDRHKQKLSKRNLDTDISAFRDNQGIFPDALVNFAVLLGWSHQEQSDLLPLRRLQEVFDSKFTKGSTIISFEKLHFLQQRYARQYIMDGGEHFQTMVHQVSYALREQFPANETAIVKGGRKLEDVVALALRADGKSYTSAAEFARRSSSLFQPLQVPRFYTPLDTNIPLSDLRTAAASILLVPHNLWIADVHRENIAAIFTPIFGDGDTSEEDINNVKAWKREFYHFLRWSLVGGAPGPSLPDLMEILGREISVERINDAMRRTFSAERGAYFEKPNIPTLSTAA